MLDLKIIDILPEEALTIENSCLLENVDDEVLSSSSIILMFPTFMDGRAYSQARRLRRDGFSGELIASGDIRADQARQYAQVGFSSLYFDKSYDQNVIDDDLRRYPAAYQRSFSDAAVIYQQRGSNAKPHFSGGGSFNE